MKNISTMNFDFILAKSHYLQELLIKLPEDKLREILVSPRYEFVESLKARLNIIYENGREEQ